jgi:hypothetical protein
MSGGAQIERFNVGQYVLRIDEYRGNPSRPSWDVSHALVTYYAPHLGAVQFSVAENGFTDGDVWWVSCARGLWAAACVLGCRLCAFSLRAAAGGC